MKKRLAPVLAVACVAAFPGLSAASMGHATTPAQVPLCMIGDSITWAGDGDCWRAYLLEHLPQLAFVGTHTARLGYSHAGEGGNSTRAVLKRLDDVPDCPYYHLLIGTNDNNGKDPAKVQSRAKATASRIEQIVLGLMKKPSVRKVFLASVLPCQTSNPLRDETNSATNVCLREKIKTSLADRKVVWVEYETPIRAIPDWSPMIRLHPTPKGYRLLARILAEAIGKELGLAPGGPAPKAKPGAGVRVENLWDDSKHCTRSPIIAGWYTVSFEVVRVTGHAPAVTVRTADRAINAPLNKTITLKGAAAGKRASVNLFTNCEGRGRYTRATITVEPVGCEIGKMLFEKSRPSMKPSAYGQGSYIDAVTPQSPGELFELP